MDHAFFRWLCKLPIGDEPLVTKGMARRVWRMNLRFQQAMGRSGIPSVPFFCYVTFHKSFHLLGLLFLGFTNEEFVHHCIFLVLSSFNLVSLLSLLQVI
jgi:hypothetical protein